MCKLNLRHDFIIEIHDGMYDMKDTMIVPSEIDNMRPRKYIKKHRVHEFKYVEHLRFQDQVVTFGMMELLDFTGYLKRYIGNNLKIKKIYTQVNYFAEYSMTCIMIGNELDKKGEHVLLFEINGKQHVFDKIMCTHILDKIYKIISKCEINYEEEASCNNE